MECCKSKRCLKQYLLQPPQQRNIVPVTGRKFNFNSISDNWIKVQFQIILTKYKGFSIFLTVYKWFWPDTSDYDKKRVFFGYVKWFWQYFTILGAFLTVYKWSWPDASGCDGKKVFFGYFGWFLHYTTVLGAFLTVY